MHYCNGWQSSSDLAYEARTRTFHPSSALLLVSCTLLASIIACTAPPAHNKTFKSPFHAESVRPDRFCLIVISAPSATGSVFDGKGALAFPSLQPPPRTTPPLARKDRFYPALSCTSTFLIGARILCRFCQAAGRRDRNDPFPKGAERAAQDSRAARGHRRRDGQGGGGRHELQGAHRAGGHDAGQGLLHAQRVREAQL